MKVSVKYSTMSDVKDAEYVNEIEAQLYDKDGNKVDGTYNYNLITKPATGAAVDAANKSASTFDIVSGTAITCETVRNIQVSDVYSHGQMTWNFTVPINTTFRAE